MKTKQLFFILFLFTAAIILNTFAQDNTKVGLPDGAIARLGKGGINLMRFSPDGTHLAVGTDVGVWVYDVPDGKETALFTGHTGQVNALAFSSDGKIFASGGFRNSVIQLWDLETNSKLSTLKLTEKHDSIAGLAFAKNNATLISLGHAREIVHWDVNTGSKLGDTISVDQYTAAAFSEDGGIFAAGDNIGIIRLWDITTGTRRSTLAEPFNEAENPEIRALAFSPDGKMIASGSNDKTVVLWNTQNNAKLATLKGHEGWITAVAFSADGKTLATGDANKIIKLWDVNTGRERATLKGHRNTINALIFAPNEAPHYGGCLASGNADGTIRFWNPDTAKELVTFTAGHTESVKAVAFAENGTMLTSAAFNGTVEVWDLKIRRELITFTAGHNDSSETAVFSPDARYFASRGRYGLIAFDSYGSGHRGNFQGDSSTQLWEIATGEEIQGPWQYKTGTIGSFAFSPDGKIFAGRGHRDILVWDLNSGSELFRLDIKSPFPSKLMFSPDGRLLAVYGTHGKIQVWDIDTHFRLPIFVESANSLAFSPDSTLLAIGHSDGIVLWDVTPTGLEEHSKISDSDKQGFQDVLIFSPDGKTLLAPPNNWSPLIQLWNVETGSSLGTLSGHTESIETLVFTHDGKALASGSVDGTVLLWDWEEVIAEKRQRNR